MKQIIGKVISIKMQKTAVVSVERLWQHKIYKKRLIKSKKYLAENLIDAKEGDKVVIIQCKPISKRKKFKIIKVIKK